MQYRTLGRTGLNVSALCLGTMMFGSWGNKDHEDSIRTIHHALDAGINFVDTADLYAHGEAEKIVGKALRGGRRDSVILASKFHNPMSDDVNDRGNSRRWIMRAVEGSLTRLGTDHLDLYQVHRPDPSTDIEETLSALTDLQRAGKIRYFGSSTFPAHEIVQAQWTAERRGLSRFVTEQPPYSIFARRIEADVLPVAEQNGIGVLTWSPLGGGWLSGAIRRDTGAKSPRDALMPGLFDVNAAQNQSKLDAVEALSSLADEAGMSLIHLALGFVLAHRGVTAPIIGPMDIEQLDSQLGAADIDLAPEILNRIDEICTPGTNMTSRDGGYVAPSLTNPALRRR